MQVVRTSQCPLRWVIDIQQISINIMLHHEFARIKPVVKDLATHNMPSHAPAILIALVPQPVMTQHLGIVVVGLKAAVVHVGCARPLKEEETVVIDLFGALVETEEDCDVFTSLVVNEF